MLPGNGRSRQNVYPANPRHRGSSGRAGDIATERHGVCGRGRHVCQTGTIADKGADKSIVRVGHRTDAVEGVGTGERLIGAEQRHIGRKPGIRQCTGGDIARVERRQASAVASKRADESIVRVGHCDDPIEGVGTCKCLIAAEQ